MSKIEERARDVAIGCTALLVTGIILQITSIYTSATASNALMQAGRIGTFVGGAGLGIALPIYIMKRGANDPHIYKKVLIAALVGVVAGAVLTAVNTGHPASKMVGQSLLTLSGGILLTAMFYWLIYGQNAQSSQAVQRRQGPRTTGTGQRLGGQNADMRTARIALLNQTQNFGSLSYRDRIKQMFGNTRLHFTPYRDAEPEGLDVNEKAHTYKLIEGERRVLLMRDQNNNLLRITADSYEATTVRAEIKRGSEEWQEIQDWNPHHNDIQPFLDYWRSAEQPQPEARPAPVRQQTRQVDKERIAAAAAARLATQTK